MTTPREADELGVTIERALINSDFYESYANTVTRELSNARRARQSVSDSTSAVEAEDSEWALQMDAASSLREAGQWAVLVDTQRAARLFAEAGRIFSEAGHGFGSFLLAVSNVREDPLGSPQAETEMLLELHRFASAGSEQPRVPPALHHPQQQAYLLLSLTAGADRLSSRNRESLQTLCLESPHRIGVAPVGPLGAPIRDFWGIARSFLDENLELFFSHYLGALQTRYEVDMESAGTNEYLWAHGAAPVDVVDIDALGIAALAARRFGVRAVLVRSDVPDFNSAKLRALLRLGTQLATSGQDPKRGGLR